MSIMIEKGSRRTNILISQLSILIISLVSTFIPQYSFFVFLIYFIVLMFIMFRKTRVWSKPPSQRDLGSPLFRESSAFKIAMFDKILIDELKKQARASMVLMITTLLVLVILPLYRGIVFPLTSMLFSIIFDNPIIVLFLSFLVMYEIIFGLMSLLRSLTLSRSGLFNLMLPQSFILYRNGIVLNDRLYIGLTHDYCYEYNSERRFVEIKNRSRQSAVIRLYTDAVSELRDRIRDIGLKDCSMS